MVQDIQRYLADEPVLAGPPRAGYRLRKFVKRNRGAVTAASVVFVAVVLGIIGTTWGWVDAVQARNDKADALDLAEKRRGQAETAADENKRLAIKESEAREKVETLAVRVEFEHYFSKTMDRPEVGLVGMASLLPKAARLKDQSLAHSLRLQLGTWSERTARLTAVCATKAPSLPWL